MSQEGIKAGFAIVAHKKLLKSKTWNMHMSEHVLMSKHIYFGKKPACLVAYYQLSPFIKDLFNHYKLHWANLNI